jgi:2-deoxy-D-gluconate 3-dehydrogenase
VPPRGTFVAFGLAIGRPGVTNVPAGATFVAFTESLRSMFDLSGRAAAVTGASRGIGAAMAEALETAGATVTRLSSADADLADPEQVAALAARLHDVDILVLNAGTIRRGPAAGHSDEDWDHVLAVNLDAPFRLAREVGRRMVERGRGKIIFTSSVLGFQGGVNVPGYAASKHAIVGLTRALANEWAPHGVNVNAIAPGYVHTDNTHALQQDPSRYEAIRARIPAGRWGEPEDLKGVTVFLASSASDYVHGAVIPVDGGWLGR